jgi:hypothetical protein
MFTQELWNKMADVKDTSVHLIPDGYVKLMQLSDHKVHFDCILFDEFQVSESS